jgi:hypothetical protein
MKKYILAIVLLMLPLSVAASNKLILLGVGGSGGGETYYVRADGTAANKEAATSPDAASTSMSLSTFNGETFKTGDIIRFSSQGGTFRGYVTPPTDGINLRNVSGEDVTFSGFDDIGTSGWTGPDVNSEYYKAIASTVYAIYRDGTQLTEGTAGSLATNEWDYSGGNLYMKEDPSGYTLIEGMTRAYVFNFDAKEKITLSGESGHKITIQGGGNFQSGYNKSIRVQNSVNIDFNYIDVSRGIGSALAIHLYDSDNCDIQNSSFSDIANNPIWFDTNSHYGSVKNCTFTDWGDAGSGDRNAVGIYNSDSIAIWDCTFTSGYRAIGIASSVGSDDIDIRRVFVDGMTEKGISVSNYTTGKMQYSIIENCGRAGLFCTIGANASPMDFEFDNITLYSNGGAGSYRQIEVYDTIAANASTSIVFKNIISDSPDFGHVRVWPNHLNNVTFDYNLYNPEGTSYWYWNATGYDTLADWKSASSQDGNSPDVADPAFTDAASDDFTLTSSSHAINEGTDVGLTQDYAGNTVPYAGTVSLVDIGAYEYQGDPTTNVFPYTFPITLE